MTSSAAQSFEESSPAEMILALSDDDILRLCYSSKKDKNQLLSVELFAWICPSTGFFVGIYVINQKSIKAMSERPLNSQQLLLLINNTAFQPGLDLIELTDKADFSDLQRLYDLIQGMT